MNLKSRSAMPWLLLGSCLSFAGCGDGGPDDGPELLVPASGTVMVDGEPASGVTLTFQPDLGTTGTGGFAATNEQGEFKILHRSGEVGIEPGSYRVGLSRMLTPEGKPVPPGESAMDHNAEESLPAKYTTPEGSTVRAEITDGTKPISIDVTTK